MVALLTALHQEHEEVWYVMSPKRFFGNKRREAGHALSGAATGAQGIGCVKTVERFVVRNVAKPGTR